MHELQCLCEMHHCAYTRVVLEHFFSFKTRTCNQFFAMSMYFRCPSKRAHVTSSLLRACTSNAFQNTHVLPVLCKVQVPVQWCGFHTCAWWVCVVPRALLAAWWCRCRGGKGDTAPYGSGTSKWGLSSVRCSRCAWHNQSGQLSGPVEDAGLAGINLQ